MLVRSLLQVYFVCLVARGLHAAEVLLVADAERGSIIKTSLQETPFRVLVNGSSGVKRPTDISYDPEENRVYWIDKDASSICRAFFNGSNYETIQNETRSEGIAIDVSRRKIFWTNVEKRAIESANLDGSNKTTSVKTFDRPSKVLVDSRNRYLYWANEQPTRIERANINGENKIIILNSTFIISSLALDSPQNVLYLASTSKSSNAIQALPLATRRLRIILNISGQTPCGLAVSNGYIYWSNGTAVYRADKNTGKDITLVPGKFDKVMGIVVVKSHSEHGKDKESKHSTDTSPGDKKILCLNGGVLARNPSNGMEQRCSCPGEYIGSFCQLNRETALQDAVNLTFKNDRSVWNRTAFKKAIANALNSFCSKTKCNENARSKRDESSIQAIQYKTEDIIIFDGYPKNLGDSWLVKFVVARRSGSNFQRSGETTALDKMTVKEAILQSKGSVEGVLGAKILSVDVQVVPADETHSEEAKINITATAIIVAGTVAPIVCVVIAITATIFIRRRRKLHDIESKVDEKPNYAFYNDEEFKLPPPPPPPPPQLLPPPPVPSNPPPKPTLPTLLETPPLEEKNPHIHVESWTTSPLHIQSITRIQDEMDGSEVSESESTNSYEGGLKSQLKRFKASFKRRSQRSNRNNSAPVKQRRPGTLERNSLPRPHSDVLPKTMHHVYDVPRLHPQRAPMTLWPRKPQLPPKEKNYTIERTTQNINPESSL